MGVRVLARCVRGLEWIVAEEMTERVGAHALELSPRQVLADVADDAPVLTLRTVDDVFLVVGKSDDHGHRKDAIEPLAADLADLDWKSHLPVLSALRASPLSATPRFDVVASFQGRRNFNRYAVEDAVGRVVAGPIGGTYVSRGPSGPGPGATELTVRVALDGRVAHTGIRAAQRPLHRREYKAATRAGTLHPPVAAAMARVVSHGLGLAVDPFAGDGTIAVELAVAGTAGRVLAADLDDERVRGAQGNLALAGPAIRERVSVAVADAGHLPLGPGRVDAVVTNPPWDVTVAPGGSLARSWAPFWASLHEVLGQEGIGCLVADEELAPAAMVREQGFTTGTEIRIRLSGRLSTIVLFTRPGARPLILGDSLAAARAGAVAAGLVGTADGY